jgi:hypothetical protein
MKVINILLKRPLANDIPKVRHCVEVVFSGFVPAVVYLDVLGDIDVVNIF